MARKAFPNYDNIAREVRVLKQFQDGQNTYVKQMLAHNEYHSITDCILAISRYEDKSAGYGLCHDDAARTAVARPRNVNSDDTATIELPDDNPIASVSLIGDDIELATCRMSELWLDPALSVIDYDDNGMFDGDTLFSVLQANVDPTSVKSSICYFCKGKGHGQRKCFRLRNLLQANGMQGNA